MSAFPARLAYFVSSHGYGHAVRSACLVNHLPPETRVTLVSGIDSGFFRREIARDFDHVKLTIDCGVVQDGPLNSQLDATWERYSAIQENRAALLSAACEALQACQADFVIGDIPPLAFAAASRLGLPSLAVSNFTWAEIYAEYASYRSGFTPLVEAIKRDYANADGYARLYPHVAEHPFIAATDVGVLTRTAARSRREVASSTGIDPGKRWCLIYIGTFGAQGIEWNNLERFDSWQFVGLASLPNAPKNYCQLSLDNVVRHADILANSDMVLGKLGYGLVSECLYWGCPIAYPERKLFAEHAALADAVQQHGIGLPITAKELAECSLGPIFDQALNLPRHRLPRDATPEILRLIETIWLARQPA